MNSLSSDQFRSITGGLQEAFDATDRDIVLSAIVIGEEVGFPERVTSENGRAGEPESFSSAYDIACRILSADRCTATKKDGYVWFSQTS